MNISAIIVAGGSGLRMQSAIRKQYLEIGGRAILGHTLSVFVNCSLISDICLVIPIEDHDYCMEHVVKPLHSSKPIRLVEGGAERQQSVYNGLKSLDLMPDDLVVIHDGVRPFVTEDLIRACVDSARDGGAAILGVPVSDTLKEEASDGTIRKTLDRKKIWAAQTPQVFSYGLIRTAHEAAIQNQRAATDDSSLVESLGYTVKLVQGSRVNLKVTSPEDLSLARSLVKDLPNSHPSSHI